MGLLAVTPGHQTRGLGRALLRAATDDLTQLGYEKAVLHALVDNVPAVQLSESEGWASVGAEYEHSLLKRPIRTFRRSLKTD
jgi:GNAT superfamily N-acetyltransferase